MDWSEIKAAARDINWLTYIGTADGRGRPHVAVVAHGFADEGVMWYATRPDTQNVANLRSNPAVAMHWPVGTNTGPGELFLRGTATIHDTPEEIARLWHAGVLSYDMSYFWSGPDDPDLVFVEVAVDYARIIGPDFKRRVWRRKTDLRQPSREVGGSRRSVAEQPSSRPKRGLGPPQSRTPRR